MAETSQTRPDWDEYFLGIAKAVAARANCTRRKVGCVLVLDHRVISTGYNGASPGVPGCLEGACPRGQATYEEIQGLGDYDRVGSKAFCSAVHAEGTGLIFSTRDTKGATIYITDPPCPNCRKLLAAAGIARAVWPTGELAGEDLVDFTTFPQLS